MTSDVRPAGLSLRDRMLKRTFDVVVSFVGLVATSGLIFLAFFAATVDTRKVGFLAQDRVGRNGKLFKLFKLRTMREIPGVTTHVTTSRDPRITSLGRLLRRTKIDELPQLLNVLLGHMSLVGPRPDVPGFADRLEGEDRIILSVRPGVTGPATLKFRDEERLLAEQDDPERYNREVVFPEKVRLNRAYVEEYRFRSDLRLIFRTLFAASDSDRSKV